MSENQLRHYKEKCLALREIRITVSRPLSRSQRRPNFCYQKGIGGSPNGYSACSYVALDTQRVDFQNGYWFVGDVHLISLHDPRLEAQQFSDRVFWLEIYDPITLQRALQSIIVGFQIKLNASRMCYR